MNLEEALEIADNVLFNTTGERLTNTQNVILRGSLEGKPYKEIDGYDEQHIKNEGANLWKLLSKALGETVSKKNCRSALERYQRRLHKSEDKEIDALVQDGSKKIESVNYNDNSISNINNIGAAPTPTYPVNGSNLPHRYPNFVGRQEEIRKVMDALASRSWIVAIDGIGGVGKTALALEVAHLCKEQNPNYKNIPQFTGFIWTSARHKVNFGLDDVIEEVLDVLTTFENRSRQLNADDKLRLAINLLASEERLLIIDNFETVTDPNLKLFVSDLPMPSKVLITSRHQIGTGERVINIGGLAEEAAVELLRGEADRLEIPISQEDTVRLKIIAYKTFGIPLVLRWVMEMVYKGQSLEWVLMSLENATANDIFDYIFKRSLSIFDSETLNIFQSMSLLQSWARIEIITGMNPNVAAIEKRIENLVSVSLLEDNRSLVPGNRRYQLPAIARYLSEKELKSSGARIGNLQYALQTYLKEIEQFTSFDDITDYLQLEFINLEHLIQEAGKTNNSAIDSLCIKLTELINQFDRQKGQTLFRYLVEDSSGQLKDCNSDLTLQLLNIIGNPFIVGNPVKPPMFFGRNNLIQSIHERFHRTIALLGQRRAGKTSILYYLRDKSSEQCIYVYIDLQGVAASSDVATILYLIALNIHKSVTYHIKGIFLKEPKKDDFNKRVFRAYLLYILDCLNSNKRLILMLDEFDILLGSPKLGNFDLLPYWRSLLEETSNKFGMIVACTPQALEQYDYDMNISPLMNIFLIKRIPLLTKEEAKDLIQKPTYNLIKYDTESIDYLFEMSGGQPFLLQLMCWQIIEVCRQEKKYEVNVEMVENVAVQKIYENSVFLEYQWRTLIDPDKKVALACAQLLQNSNSITLNQIKGLLDEKESNLLERDIKICLRRLQDYALLTEHQNSEFQFTMKIFQRWLNERIISL